jgi:hypothetical protein
VVVGENVEGDVIGAVVDIVAVVEVVVGDKVVGGITEVLVDVDMIVVSSPHPMLQDSTSGKAPGPLTQHGQVKVKSHSRRRKHWVSNQVKYSQEESKRQAS